MVRKPLFCLSILCILILVFVIYFAYTREEFKPSQSIEAIPHDAALIVKSSELIRIIEERQKNPIWIELLNFPAIEKIDQQIGFLDSITTINQDIRNFLERQEVVFSLHLAGKFRYEYIFYVSLRDRNDEKRILDFMAGQISGQGQLTERKYELKKIYEANFMNGTSKNFSYSISNGLFIFSHSSILVEEAIRQIDLDSPLSLQPGFSRIQGTAGKNVDANLYLNLKTFPQLISQLLSDGVQSYLDGTGVLAEWAALDLNLKNEALLFNGFSSTETLNTQLLNLFQSQSPQRIEIQRIVPSDFACFLAFGFEDYQQYKQQYEEYLDINGLLRSYKKEIDEFNTEYGIEVDKEFAGLIDRELALIFTDIQNLEGEDNIFYAFRCKSQSEAAEVLEEILQLVSDKEAIHISHLVFDRTIANDYEQRCYQVPVRELGKNLFGNFMAGINNHYCTFIGNYLVFGNSVNALSKYVHLNMLQSTLDSDLDFNRLSDYTASRSNIHLFVNIPRSGELLERYFSEDVQSDLGSGMESLMKFQAFSYQLSKGNQLLYNNSFIKYSQEIKDEPHTLWGSRLDNPIRMKPKLVVNHYTNEKEIFLQDSENSIYLINSSGRILWKIPCSGKINSDIFQIDYYKNGKLQYVFSTEDNIHLIDRNGNKVEKYPLALRASTRTGLSLFDYDRNRDYRIVVPTNDKKIYVYDIEGRLISGWEFNKTDDEVYHPMQHFRVQERDYIVCADRYNVYILNRRGQSRVNVKEHFPVSRQNSCLLDRGSLNSKPRFVMTDTLGHVHFIYLDGSVEETVLSDFTPDHYFDYQDLNGDNVKEYIFIDMGILEVFDSEKSRVFSYEFDSPIRQRPVIYQFSGSDRKIGILSDGSNEIYLINNDGSVYQGFPLSGSTMFSIGFFSNSAESFNLVVGGSENFVYNYAVK